MKKGWTIWFVGLHGSGKSTISERLAGILRGKNIHVVVLDGDEIRKAISSDLGYTLEGRNTHMRRIADLCRIISDNGIHAIACVASPTGKSRDYARKNLQNIIIAYAKCPIEICEQRDVKGHYKKARKKEKGFENFLGVSLPFEEPKNVDIVLNTDKESIDESTKKLVEFLKRKNVIDL